MGIIIWLVVGGIVGWLASIVMKTDAEQGVLTNIVVGVVGAGSSGSSKPRSKPPSGSPGALKFAGRMATARAMPGKRRTPTISDLPSSRRSHWVSPT